MNQYTCNWIENLSSVNQQILFSSCCPKICSRDFSTFLLRNLVVEATRLTNLLFRKRKITSAATKIDHISGKSNEHCLVKGNWLRGHVCFACELNIVKWCCMLLASSVTISNLCCEIFASRGRCGYSFCDSVYKRECNTCTCFEVCHVIEIKFKLMFHIQNTNFVE